MNGMASLQKPNNRSLVNFLPWVLSFALPLPGNAEDWPMWRRDAGRTATSPASLPGELALKWVRELPANAPAYRDERLQFDRGYEPVVLGQRMFVASAVDDSVAAYDTRTGEQLWKFYAEGPVRFAPVSGDGKIIFGADEGYVYCVDASDGQLAWKFKAVPSDRRILGNGRLISVWPVRGGPVLKDGRVYFAAGVWPLEGVFVYCLDAATGEVVWLNDRLSHLYGQHPHNTDGYGGLAPQGYLVIDGDDLVVPCSVAYPARLDLGSGELKTFELPAAGRFTGGWFASTPAEEERNRLKRRGLLFDQDISRKRHEDKPRSEGLPGIRSTIRVGDKEFRFENGYPGVSGAVHSMLSADGKLFVVTQEGSIYCFGKEGGEVRRHGRQKVVATRDSPRAEELVQVSSASNGYAVVLGLDDPGFLKTLVEKTGLQVIGVDADPRKVAALRESLQLPAARLALHVADPLAFEMPKYFAGLVVLNVTPEAEDVRRIYDSLRPYGGCLVGVPAAMGVFAKGLEGARVETGPKGGNLTVFRTGGLAGAANYLADWNVTVDERVVSPLGLLWFGDSVAHFKRSPQPAYIDGVMVSVDKDWLDASNRRGGKDYRLLEPVLSDVYTGRVFSPGESAEIRSKNPAVAQKSVVDKVTVQPSQYRPEGQLAVENRTGVSGMRINPLTGEEEPRAFPKRYGCDGGIDYGALFTMRSATAAFYDKRVESGTVNISGPRSGCTNSLIPANGLLNVPYFYEGCTCSYPLPMSLSLVSMPESFEQWASWGEVPYSQMEGKIKRLGINLGAPGDRKTRDGTLWLNYPDVGGPSPEMSITTQPESPSTFYRHSLFLGKGGDAWPWVAASGIRDLREITVNGILPGNYTVRLVFIDPDGKESVFNVGINGARILKGFNPRKKAGATLRGFQHVQDEVKIAGSLAISLEPIAGRTVLCGIELFPL
jgi:hypothetical protein